MVGAPDVVQPWMPRAARDSDACLWHVSIVGGARRRGCAAAGVSVFSGGPVIRDIGRASVEGAATSSDTVMRAMAHILLLTDRDWTHPQGGGTGANLFGQVAYWLEWGHQVTVVAGTYEGAEAVSRPAPGLELHHMGSRVTVF